MWMLFFKVREPYQILFLGSVLFMHQQDDWASDRGWKKRHEKTGNEAMFTIIMHVEMGKLYAHFLRGIKTNAHFRENYQRIIYVE